MSLVKNIFDQSEDMAEYLRNHPDFFVAHPELLTDLTLPSITEKNVASFLEYQVVRLRQQVRDIQNQLHEQENSILTAGQFTTNIHSLALELFASSTPEELYNILQRRLKMHYAAARVLLLVFSNHNPATHHTDLRYLPVISKLRFMFAEIFDRNKPLCGSLQEEHLGALFGKDIESIKSTVLLPLNHMARTDAHWQGLLVLGSHEQNRYSHGPELDLLIFTRDIIDLLLQNFIEKMN